MKLSPDVYRRVCRALARGERHAAIARELNLSVWTIAQIADRRRYDDHLPTEMIHLPEDDAPADYDAQNLGRCPGCGAMIYVWPCVACRLATAQRGLLPLVDEIDEEDEDDSLEDFFGEVA
jgi:hypothetical protein